MHSTTWTNCSIFNELTVLHSGLAHWHRSCNLNETNTKIGFPGWPEHNLDCVPVLGGQLTEGACTGPLFFCKALCSHLRIPARTGESSPTALPACRPAANLPQVLPRTGNKEILSKDSATYSITTLYAGRPQSRTGRNAPDDARTQFQVNP